MEASNLTQYKDKILVIDDTPANLKLLTQMLSHHGYEVRVAPNGSMGLNAALTEPPDLILLDVKMPQINGYQVCEHLKADLRTRDIPVIFLSALDRTTDKVKAFQTGGVDYITKPFELVEVLARVENQLTLRSLQQALQQAERESRLLFEASKALNDSPDLRSAIAAILQLICQTIPWEGAEAWMPDETGTRLELASSYSSGALELKPLQQQSQELSFALGEGLPGRIWETKQPEWIENCSIESIAVDWQAPFAATASLKAIFGVPILANHEAIAILIFYCSDTHCCQPQAVSLVAAVATQLTAFIRRKQAEEALQQQKAKTEELLLNILPQPIAARLQRGESAIADYFGDASVLFADIVGFTEFSASKPPKEIVKILNEIFSEFDRLTRDCGLEKIKTIGDSYMVAGGIPIAGSDHTEKIARMSLGMLSCIEQYNAETGQRFQLRVGIDIGPVVAGIIGTSKFIYDLWGDTVNVASRMESTGEAGKIQVTAAVRDRLHEQFDFAARGEVSVKGKGTLQTYWLLERQKR